MRIYLTSKREGYKMGRNRYGKRVNGKRSKFEVSFSKLLDKLGIKYSYETKKISYVQPEVKRTYTPDFIVGNKVFETKGRLTLEERKKILWILDSNPDLDLTLVLQAPNNKIRKGSNTTYAMWCEKNGVKWTSLNKFSLEYGNFR